MQKYSFIFILVVVFIFRESDAISENLKIDPLNNNGLCISHAVNDDLFLGCNISPLPQSDKIQGYVEKIEISESELIVKGWAAQLNPPGKVQQIFLIINGELRAITSPNESREDVALVFKSQDMINSGYKFVIFHEKNLLPGQIKISVFAVDNDNNSKKLQYYDDSSIYK